MKYAHKSLHEVLFIPLSACAVLAIVAAAAFAATAVEKLLPGKDAVKGWAVVENSLQYGKGKDLTNIYNGGYELYTDNGVVDAARQMYQRDGDYVEVTIHTMKSPKAADSFLKYWQKENKVKALSKTKLSSYFLVRQPNTAAYFRTGKYFTTVNAFHSGDKAKKDVMAFLGVIEKNISKL